MRQKFKINIETESPGDRKIDISRLLNLVSAGLGLGMAGNERCAVTVIEKERDLMVGEETIPGPGEPDLDSDRTQDQERGIIRDEIGRKRFVPVTVPVIEKRIKIIKMLATEDDDPEAAHLMEDDLYRSVLREIDRNDKGAAGSLAAAVLKAAEIDYDRWMT